MSMASRAIDGLARERVRMRHKSGIYGEYRYVFLRTEAETAPFLKRRRRHSRLVRRPTLAALPTCQKNRRGAHGAAVAHDCAFVLGPSSAYPNDD